MALRGDLWGTDCSRAFLEPGAKMAGSWECPGWPAACRGNCLAPGLAEQSVHHL